MAIRIHWDNLQRTAIRMEIDSLDEGWKEFDSSLAAIKQMAATVDHPVDLIVIPHPGVRPPAGALQKFRRAFINPTSRTSHAGLTIIVASNPFTRTLFGAIYRLYGHLTDDLVMVESLADAQATVASRHPAPQKQLAERPADRPFPPLSINRYNKPLSRRIPLRVQ